MGRGRNDKEDPRYRNGAIFRVIFRWRLLLAERNLFLILLLLNGIAGISWIMANIVIINRLLSVPGGNCRRGATWSPKLKRQWTVSITVCPSS